jgi:hypothetical protein
MSDKAEVASFHSLGKVPLKKWFTILWFTGCSHLLLGQTFHQNQDTSAFKSWGLAFETPVFYQWNGYPGKLNYGGGVLAWYQFNRWTFLAGFRGLVNNYTALSEGWLHDRWSPTEMEFPFRAAYRIRQRRGIEWGAFAGLAWKSKHHFSFYQYSEYYTFRFPDFNQPIHYLTEIHRDWGLALQQGMYLQLDPFERTRISFWVAADQSMDKLKIVSFYKGYNGKGFGDAESIRQHRVWYHSAMIGIGVSLKLSKA